MATIIELLGRLDELDAEDVIFAKPAWHENSEARLFRLTENHRIPTDAKALGFEYFLEVDLVRQVLEEFRDKPDVTDAEKCRRVIQYALLDA